MPFTTLTPAVRSEKGMSKMSRFVHTSRSVGEVFLGKNLKSAELVAIKKLKLLRRGQDRLPFILKEIEIIATSAHPNIVRYIESFRVEDELWVGAKTLLGTDFCSRL